LPSHLLSRLLKLGPIGAIVLALILGLGYGLSKPAPFIVSNVVLPSPKPLPAFDLQSTQAESFDQHALLGQWWLLFSGYTECPDVCPATLSILAQWQRDRPATDPKVQLVFATVDPQQDSLANLRAYLSYFDAQILGLTGRAEELNRLLVGLGFYPVGHQALEPLARSEARLLTHSGAVAVINPRGQLHALLRAPITLAMLQLQLPQILLALPPPTAR
jgi:protein SCO1/2